MYFLYNTTLPHNFQEKFLVDKAFEWCNFQVQALCCLHCSFGGEKKKKRKKEDSNFKNYEAFTSSCKKVSKFSCVVSCM